MTAVLAEPGRSRRPARSNPWLQRILGAAKGLLPVVALLLVWELAFGDDPLRFPKPSLWPDAVLALREDGLLADALWRSLGTFAVGLSIATVVGVVVGVAVGSSARLERALSPTFDFFRGLPVPVIVPASILLLGVGFSTNAAIVAFAVVWPILLNTVMACRSIPQVRRDLARVMDLSAAAAFVKITLPSVLPAAVVGLRISASLGVITTLVVEMLAGGGGIGFLLLERQARYDAAGMWGLLALVGVFGFLLNAALSGVDRWVTPPD